MALSGDDFEDGSIAAYWTSTDPNANCTFTESSSLLNIGLSSGQAHDFYTGNLTAPRLTQAVSDSNFRVEAKWTSAVNAAFKMQGFVFIQDANTAVRCDTYFNDLGHQRIFAATESGGTFTNQVDADISNTTPFYGRVTRNSTSWVYDYSADGITWTNAVSFTFSLSATAVGIIAANADPGTGAPAFTSSCEYFRVTPMARPRVYSQAVNRASYY